VRAPLNNVCCGRHVISDGVCEDLRCVGHLAESSGCSKGYKLLGPDSSHQDTQPVASALARVHQEVEAARDRAAEAESEVKRLRAKLEATLHAEAKLARQMAADMATRERESIQTRQKLECATQQLFAYQVAASNTHAHSLSLSPPVSCTLNFTIRSSCVSFIASMPSLLQMNTASRCPLSAQLVVPCNCRWKTSSSGISSGALCL